MLSDIATGLIIGIVAMTIAIENGFQAALDGLPFVRGLDELIRVFVNDAIPIQNDVAYVAGWHGGVTPCP